MESKDHKPDIIGNVPTITKAVVRLAPRIHIIEHQNMYKPGVLTSMFVFILIESRPTASENANKLPHEKDHKEV